MGRSALLVGLVAAVGLVTVGSARTFRGNCLTSGLWTSDYKEFNIGQAACQWNGGVKGCQFWDNESRGMRSRNPRYEGNPSRGTDYVYTCKDGEKKYLFAYDRATNVYYPDLRFIRCVLKGDHGRTGLLDNVGAWTVKNEQQVLDAKAERRVATCDGNKVQYG